MHALVAALFFLAQPFWEARPPEQWTDREIEAMRYNSPWAQAVGPPPVLLVYLATAAPVEQAEDEARHRAKGLVSQPDFDYAEYLRENREKNLILAVPYYTLSGLGKAEEERKLEEESVMVIGRRTYHIAGYFPPAPSDPVLRLAFPRAAQLSDKAILFRLYIPGVAFPEREVEFKVKDLMYHGKLEM
jgi:hypothetical protein